MQTYKLPPRARPAGFTLVELMISVALVLVLILGINQVFSITSQGIAGGQALSAAIRDNRGANAVMYGDIRNVVMPRNATGGTFDDGPAFVIRSERQYAYRNRADHLGDPDGAGMDAPTDAEIEDWDLDNNNSDTDPGETTAAALVNARSHRRDQLMFFARDLFRRQTGASADGADTDPFVARMSSSEAMVWYGHLELTGTASAGLVDYATDWALGRVVIGMRTPEGPFPGVILDDRGVEQSFIRRIAAYDPNNPDAYYDNLHPFQKNSAMLQEHRVDLAGTSIAEFTDILAGYHRLWQYRRGDISVPPDPAPPWYERMTDFRYQANPTPDRPLTSESVASMAPIFLRGCTQFVVEFAGDFVTQDTATFLNGTPTDVNPFFGQVSGQYPPVPDGETDFVVHFEDADGDGQIDRGEHETARRVVRWYGFPRDTNGDGRIPGWAGANTTANAMPDVVPLRDVVSSGIKVLYNPDNDPTLVAHRIEHFTDEDGFELPTMRDYAGLGDDGILPEARYIASWGPDSQLVGKPRMIRITFALDEPGGSMAAEQTYEYVFELP
jgi:prepilin-type N-terminal cleavage/methylation domain-containing protein